VPAGLRAAAGQIGDPQVRNRGTIGGSVAHADPAADLPIILAALDAVIHLAGPAGARTLAAGEFFHGFFQTARMPAEMVTAVTVPARGASAYAKMPNPASGYCMVGAGVVILAAGGVCTSARVAVGGLTAAPVRCPSVEAALAGQPLTAGTLGAAADLVDGDLPPDLIGDMHADEAYRRAMVRVYLKRALLEARRAV
jgi:carbon-monoxide dehydrogenase medium subunit